MGRDVEVDNRYKAPDNLREPTAMEKDYFIKNFWELGANRDAKYAEYVAEISETLKVTDGIITWVSEEIDDFVLLVSVECQGEVYKCVSLTIANDDEVKNINTGDEVTVFCCYNKKKEVQEIFTVATKESINNYEKGV